MTPAELEQLETLLVNFRDWIDTKDASSIAKARTIYLANKLEMQHQENKQRLEFTLRMVRSQMPPGPPPF